MERDGGGIAVTEGLLALLIFSSVLSSLLPGTRGVSFAAWVISAVGVAFIHPGWFQSWQGMPLTVLIVPLIQVIMFGMGTTLSARDFLRACRNPRPVTIGVVLQFLVMPLLGAGLAHAFGFEGAVAAGIVLTGACSGGVASNVMAYLAKGDVALSVTMTACSTLLSPLVTPVLMKLLAGTFVPIDVLAMTLSICNMIITPILAGLIAHEFLFSRRAADFTPRFLLASLLGAGLLMTYCLLLPLPWWGSLLTLRNGVLIGAVLIGISLLARLYLGRQTAAARPRLEQGFSLLSMAGICLIIAIIVAQTRETLLTAGALLLLVAALHNGVGYLAGYWLSRVLGLSEKESRTVAFEVGMQNSGMATGLALETLKSPAAALAPALFGPWMNVSGSLLASWWKSRPVPSESGVMVPVETV
ncbi:MAG: bile acid:sodium symporter family protein [Planctomycetaceae bacterium]|nr:bile acid:sodium symporter family protein [Planctomycetaceae bacterium]